MSLDLEASSSQYAELTTPAITAQPFTMACWIIAETLVADMALMQLADSAVDNHFHEMDVSAGDLLRAGSAAGGTTNVANSVGAVAAGVWQHCLVTHGPTSGNDRQVSLNGATLATSTTNRAATSLDRFRLGASAGATAAQFYDGLIAMAAWWNVQLNQREATALFKGANPGMIRPSALRHFWPLWDDGRDLGRGHKTLSLVGSPVFVDRMPPVAWNTGAISIPFTTSAPAAPVPRHPAINHQNPALLAQGWIRDRLTGLWRRPTPSFPESAVI